MNVRLIGFFLFLAVFGFAQDNVNSTTIGETTAERLALVIGVSSYKSVKTSPYIENDCLRLRYALKKCGNFDVITISNNSDLKPTKENIINTLLTIKENAASYKTFILYYAGFSFCIDDENFIAPTDTDFYDPRNTAIRISDLTEILTEINLSTKTGVFLDYGRVNLNSFMGKGLPLPEIPKEQLGLSILYSSDGKTPSYDFEEYKSGVFSYYLYNAISGENNVENYANKDGFSSFNEISSYVIEQTTVWALNNKPDFVQTPVFFSLDEKDFIISSSSDSDFDVESLGFYDSTKTKKFKKNFSSETLTFLGFSLYLSIKPFFYENIVLRGVFIYPDGEVMGSLKKTFSKDELETDSLEWDKRFGFKKPGYWEPGKYKFELYMNNQKIKEENFTVK